MEDDTLLSSGEITNRLAAESLLTYAKVKNDAAKYLKISVTDLTKIVNEKRSASKAGQKAAEKETTLAKYKDEAAAAAQTADEEMFPPVDEWDCTVKPAELFNDISKLILRFIACDQPTADAATLWIVMTWMASAVQTLPIALITAPEKRCGKTQLLTVMGKLVYRSLSASNISPAALYRAIEEWAPCLLIDEVDSFLRDNEEMRGIINSGHSRENAYVLRCEGDDHKPTRFSTFCPKVLSGIGKLAGTIMDRSIILSLRRKSVTDKTGVVPF